MWVLTSDNLERGKNVGTRSQDYDEHCSDKLCHRFRLLDADDKVYYEGLSNDCDSGKAFDPLDDFGRGYAGCVSIEFLKNGTWQPL